MPRTTGERTPPLFTWEEIKPRRDARLKELDAMIAAEDGVVVASVENLERRIENRRRQRQRGEANRRYRAKEKAQPPTQEELVQRAWERDAGEELPEDERRALAGVFVNAMEGMVKDGMATD